jgi:hypothetical protein
VLAGLAAIAACYLSWRERDPLPVMTCLGALACALNEPIYDILGKIVYASDSAMAFTAFGRSIPWFLVLGYLPWVGLMPYLISTMMATGIARAGLHWVAAGSLASVTVVETIGNWLHGWTYYGQLPLKYLVVAPQMAPVPIVAGALLYLFAHPLTGWKRAMAGFAISTLALPMIFASASWPLYLGLNTRLPVFMQWFAGLAMIAFSAAMVAAATSIAARVHRLETTSTTGSKSALDLATTSADGLGSGAESDSSRPHRSHQRLAHNPEERTR